MDYTNSDIWEDRPELEQFSSSSIQKLTGPATTMYADYPWMETLLKRRGYLEIPNVLKPRGLTESVSRGHAMHTAVLRLRKAIQDKQPIFVWGDYDTDGITAICCLYTCLKCAGAEVTWGMPSRLEEGYGVSAESIDKQALKHSVVITVDNGITSGEQIKLLTEQGYEVIVTDHHLPEGDLPDCLIVNPKVYTNEENDEYMASGCYVAAKLGLLLLCNDRDKDTFTIDENLWAQPGVQGNLFDYVQALVGMSMISDNIPMNATMRLECLKGITAINVVKHDGIRALLAMCGAKDNQNLSSLFLAYSVIPKINAAGRMGQPKAAVELLLSHKDISLGKTSTLLLANKLKYMNTDRKIIENQIFAEAMKEIENYPYQNSIVLYNPTWHPGVLGIIAARVAEVMSRPAIIISRNGEKIEGSGRTVGDFDLHSALAECKEHLHRFGGHKAAAGLGIEEDKIPAFQAAFDACVAKSDHPKHTTYLIDAEVKVKDLYDVLVLMFLENFEPIAQGNSELIFKVADVYVSQVKYRGDVGTIYVTDDEGMSMAISKYRPRVDLNDYLHRRIDVLFSPQLIYFGGTTSAEFRLHSIHLK